MGIEKINVVLPGGLTRDADSDIEKDKQAMRRVLELAVALNDDMYADIAISLAFLRIAKGNDLDELFPK